MGTIYWQVIAKGSECSTVEGLKTLIEEKGTLAE
jgi:hypothetical protein